MHLLVFILAWHTCFPCAIQNSIFRFYHFISKGYLVPRTLGHRPYTHSTGNFVLFVSFSIIFRQKSLDYLLTWCADPEKERWRECDRRGRKYTVNILKIYHKLFDWTSGSAEVEKVAALVNQSVTSRDQVLVDWYIFQSWYFITVSSSLSIQTSVVTL